jgi:sacsin
MVWEHLKHMASSAENLNDDEVESFLSDLRDSYNYLQENLGESWATFSDFRRCKVWLNLDITDPTLVRKVDIQSGPQSPWSDIDHLILDSSCDTKNLKSVGQALIPYDRLLRSLGCKSIVQPKVEIPHREPPPSVSSSLSRLRREGKLLDVTLVADDGSVSAHRIVLAAASDYFARQFNGKWSNNDSIRLKEFSKSTISTVVDFAYADSFLWTSMKPVKEDDLDTIANKLDEFLDLLAAANYFDMPELMSQVENEILETARIFIKEPNVLGVRERAAEANAHRVEDYCRKYYEQNKEAVDLAMEK